jgi:hypothetical protein
MPAAFFGIAFAIIFENLISYHSLSVGDKTSLAGELPSFHVPQVNWTNENIWLVAKYSIMLSVCSFTFFESKLLFSDYWIVGIDYDAQFVRCLFGSWPEREASSIWEKEQ